MSETIKLNQLLPLLIAVKYSSVHGDPALGWHCKMTFIDYTTSGTGKSKSIAKNNAAHAMVIKLTKHTAPPEFRCDASP